MYDRLFINHRFIQDDLCLKLENRFRCSVEVDEFGLYHLWFNRRRSLSLDDLNDIRYFFNDDAFLIYSWDNSLRVVAKYNRFE